MEPEEYSKMYQLEDKHWWFVGKRYLINQFIKKGKGLIFLDIGCGTGANLFYLNRSGQNIGIDYSPFAINLAKKRGLNKIAIASASKLPFKTNSFDIIGCFDVLYHKKIANESEAINEICRVCKKNGQLIVMDSALKCLESPHDKAVHARTRFSLNSLTEKIRQNGFKIEKASYYNFFLFPIIFLVRKINRVIKYNSGTDIKKTNCFLNFFLGSILKLEAKCLRIASFPFGASVFVVAKKN